MNKKTLFSLLLVAIAVYFLCTEFPNNKKPKYQHNDGFVFGTVYSVTYSNPDDIILDFCCGSGSIPLAAALEGRRYIGIDNGICEHIGSIYNNKPWADIASERILTALVHGVDIFETSVTHKVSTIKNKKLF